MYRVFTLRGHRALDIPLEPALRGHETKSAMPAPAFDVTGSPRDVTATTMTTNAYFRYAGTAGTGNIEDHCDVDSNGKITRDGEDVDALYYEVASSYSSSSVLRLVLHGERLEVDFEPEPSSCGAPDVDVDGDETHVEFGIPSTNGQTCVWVSDPQSGPNTHVKLRVTIKRLPPPPT